MEKIEVLGLIFVLLTSASDLAAAPLPAKDIPYGKVRDQLMSAGWRPAKNKRINEASLYAQDVFNNGLTEVVDCVSMEMDGCRFSFSKGHQTLLVDTYGKDLKVGSYHITHLTGYH